MSGIPSKILFWNNWDDFIGVSFLAYDGGSYPLHEETEEKYIELKIQDGTI